MTDLATKPGGDATPSDNDATVAIDSSGAGDGTSTYEWAPAEEQPKKRRTGLWIGLGAGAVVVALAASSLVLIAPGTAVAGVPVGFMTEGVAAGAIESRLDDTTVTLTGAEGDVVVTAADLGASVDGAALAKQAFSEHPMWNPGAWFQAPATAEVTIDPAAAEAAIREVQPALFTAPVDATLAFDSSTQTYVATPATDGVGIDITSVQTALQDAFVAGEQNATVAAEATTVAPKVSTDTASATAAQLNGMLDTVGFYVGEERTIPVDRATAAAWLTVTPTDDGTYSISADASAIQPLVDGLAAQVDRPAVNAEIISNTSDAVLRTVTAGATGRQIGDTSTIAADFANQLSTGSANFALPVSETPFTTDLKRRLLEVDLGEQRLYLKENGNVVDTWLISSGAAATPTIQGDYRIQYHVPSQTMRGRNADGSLYETPNVKTVMYFQGDYAFHGVYWHSNWGHRMSHGCVGMPEYRAQQIYDWAPNGVDVSIHG